MYLHQSNNLSNGLTLSSNHNSLNMSDLHDAFLSHPHLATSPHLTTNHHLNSHSAGAAISTSPASAVHRHFDEQNEENFLEPYDDYGHRKLASDSDPCELASADNLLGTEPAAISKHSLSCSPSISSASSTTPHLNNITNFISNSSLNEQLNQLADQTKSDGSLDCSRDNGKLLFTSDKFDVDQNDQYVSMDPLTRFLSLHPKYLELFDRFYNFLFNGDGPLRYPVRHYIAIMAAARHHCKYLVNDQQEQFKKVGGDVKWLESIKYAPKKIQNLSEINKILAHQPWQLTKEHIERLTKGEDNWSLSELVQAIVIMAQFHTLASFVFGCGFNDADLQWSTKANLTIGSNYNSNNISDLLLTRTHISSAPPSPPSPNSLNGLLIETNLNKASEAGQLADSGVDTQPGDSMDTNSTESLNSAKVAGNQSPPASGQCAKAGGSKPTNVANTPNSFYPVQPSQQANSLEILMRKMQNISEQKQQFELDNQEELVKNQSLEIHLNASTQPLTTDAGHSPTSSSANTSSLPCACTNTSPGLLPSSEDNQADELGRFVFDTKFCYADFARSRARTDAVTTFKVQDYSWSDHAFSLVNRLYSDVGNMLDEKFTTIYNLTYWTMGRKTNVDTRLFRRAIWNYIQCMYGIRHDDYNYHQINLLLERQLKTYIKTVCCFPHQCRRKDCDTVMAEFRRSEKIHVNIMIAEARLQAELLYALRTISRYMT